MSEAASIDELINNLDAYKAQLADVEAAIAADPDQADYVEAAAGLRDLIRLTEELLADGRDTAAASAAVAVPAAPTTALTHERPDMVFAAPSPSSSLPAEIRLQISSQNALLALEGKAPAAWAIGSEVEALWGSDQGHYAARILGATPDYHFFIEFLGYGDRETVPRTALRPKRDDDNKGGGTDEADGAKSNAAAANNPLKRRRVDDAPLLSEMPKSFAIKEGDDEKTMEKKKKLIKNFKKQQRFAEMDQVQKQKADNWKSFLNKGVKGGGKRESIFK